ncbi:NUDIX hydrolase domain-like protein [Mycena floridula]|nr:NUDIX hydrolase domain-like protein [Mycena floridula]
MSSSPKPINRLGYHRQKLKFNQLRKIPPPSKESARCLKTLASYRSAKPKLKFPRARCAAVLVALFVGRQGDLYVLLSRRSANLRTYAGDTSLPGGKVDPADRTFEDTARREAFEEIGLPRDRRKVPLLCILEPFLAGNQLIVTPVVVLILDNTLQPILNTSEVQSLFSHPLVAFLSSSPPFPAESELVEVPYHTYTDWDYVGDGQRKIRMHRFLTGREAGGIKPVFGLTASILIHTAMIGYAREPDFEVYPPRAPGWEERIAHGMLVHPVYREAAEKEGLKIDWDLVRRLASAPLEMERSIRSKL